MKKVFLLYFVLLIAFVHLNSCLAQTGNHTSLTKQIVEETIQNSLYPASNNSDVSKTTLEFHNVTIAKPRTLKTEELYGFAGGTTIYPVLVKFTSTDRIQDDPKIQPSFDIHDITQEYYFYKDDFGKWALDIVSGSGNRDVETQK
ncbi:MAG: hypothetical protein Q8891_04525 [Bacteroidota bacterium]|nr:hypothetical protein [Bacteroidota bacterium]